MSPEGSIDADVKVDGRVVRYQVVGAPGGTPVFLAHGTPGSRIGPRPRAGVLYRLGVRLISYDRPGYGGSDPKHGRNVADCAADVAAIADRLGVRTFGVVGRSGGGPHALAVAAMLPDRVERAAVLVSFAPRRAGDDDFDWFEGMNDANQRGFTADPAEEQKLVESLRLMADRTRRRPASLLESLRTQISGPDFDFVKDPTIERLLLEAYAEATRPGPYGWIDDVLALRRDWGFSLSDVHQRVRLWHGAADNVVPASHTRWLADRLHDADLHVQSDSAHFGAMGILPAMLSWLIETPITVS